MQCRVCRSDVLERSRFCPSCGAALADSAVATVAGPPPPSRPPSTDSLDEARFVPGAMLVGRYRIVALLGRGGMGEVYRAEDLKLAQPVALKFLPEELAQDPERLARFHQEVRVARQVSHPNVCRVYDIGEADGQHFLSMEYVDGEDLASLLRRIGRLPAAKATELARQLCAGLAAAHDRGVLHRDLKPANVLIDGRGRARIADFGLSGFADERRNREVVAGTPGYMAPEQFAGQGTSTRSDIYALGLVLYELFTGQPALAVVKGSRSGLAVGRLADPEEPARPSTIAADIDPTIERVILRCLEKDPARRPSSVVAIAAALPGGDPLAAALAAGETPSPAMVAAAGDADSVSIRTITLCSVLIVAGLLLATILSERSTVLRQTPFEQSPAALEQRARNVIQALGYSDPPADRAYGLLYNGDFRRYAEVEEPRATYQAQLESGLPSPITFWYRQSPRYLEVINGVGAVSTTNPPMTLSGMIRVSLDPQGRLVQLDAVPQQVESNPAPSRPDEWAGLWEASGLDMTRFTAAEPMWVPLTPFDARAAWTGSFSHAPDVLMRVEAASWRGLPVYFQVIGPWTRPTRMQPAVQQTAAQRIAEPSVEGLNLVLAGIALFMALRNFRQNRGDVRGATRLAAFSFCCTMLGWLWSTNHVPTPGEFTSFQWAISSALFSAALFWALYMALEPHIRKRWPHSMVGWTRLLSGAVRDPLVGAHLLIGIAFGVAYTLLFWLGSFLQLAGPMSTVLLNSVVGTPQMLEVFVRDLRNSMAIAMGVFFFLFLLRALLRRQWLAAVVLTLVFMAIAAAGNPGFGAAGSPLIRGSIAAVQFGLATFILVRFGVLPMVVGVFVSSILPNFPLTTDFSTWYAGSTLFVLAVVLGLTAFALHSAIGERRVFKESFLDAA